MITAETGDELVSTRAVSETKRNRFEDIRGRVAGGEAAVTPRDAESAEGGGG